MLDKREPEPNTEIAAGEVCSLPTDPWQAEHDVRRRARGTRHDLEQCIANAAGVGQCAWPGCDLHRAGYVSHEYADAPLCIGHIYETWRLARDLAEKRENRQATTSVRVAPREDFHARRTVEQPVATIGWIYYLRIGDNIKIGYASRLLQRLRQYPPTAELLAAHRGTKVDEKVVHSLLYLHRIAGREWYSQNDEVLTYIAKIVARFGPCQDPRPVRAPESSGHTVQMRRRSGARSSRK